LAAAPKQHLLTRKSVAISFAKRDNGVDLLDIKNPLASLCHIHRTRNSLRYNNVASRVNC
jgi:hypothetical protein